MPSQPAHPRGHPCGRAVPHGHAGLCELFACCGIVQLVAHVMFALRCWQFWWHATCKRTGRNCWAIESDACRSARACSAGANFHKCVNEAASHPSPFLSQQVVYPGGFPRNYRQTGFELDGGWGWHIYDPLCWAAQTEVRHAWWAPPPQHPVARLQQDSLAVCPMLGSCT